MVYRDKQDEDEGDLLTGTRKCKACGERKPMTEFHWANKHRCRRRKCKACTDGRRAELREADPERVLREAVRHRRAYLLKEYGITPEQYDEMWASQDGKCAICDRALDTAHIDHDHSTGEVRGLLCFTCNTALGKFQDSVEILRSAIAYLTRQEV